MVFIVTIPRRFDRAGGFTWLDFENILPINWAYDGDEPGDDSPTAELLPVHGSVT
jgi:hypothetical protein